MPAVVLETQFDSDPIGYASDYLIGAYQSLFFQRYGHIDSAQCGKGWKGSKGQCVSTHLDRSSIRKRPGAKLRQCGKGWLGVVGSCKRNPKRASLDESQVMNRVGELVEQHGREEAVKLRTVGREIIDKLKKLSADDDEFWERDWEDEFSDQVFNAYKKIYEKIGSSKEGRRLIQRLRKTEVIGKGETIEDLDFESDAIHDVYDRVMPHISKRIERIVHLNPDEYKSHDSKKTVERARKWLRSQINEKTDRLEFLQNKGTRDEKLEQEIARLKKTKRGWDAVRYRKSQENRADSTHLDRAGQGKPCGKGWIGARKKCSKDKAAQLASDLKSGDAAAKARVKRGKELAAERQRLRREVEGRAVKPDAKGKAIALQFGKDAKNNIVPTNLTNRRSLLNQVKGQQLELQRLGESANEAIEKQKMLDEIRKTLAEAEPQNAVSKLKQRRIEKLNRSLKGRLSQPEAKWTNSLRKSLEIIHPGKELKLPKGTTQAEYQKIVNDIISGDKATIKKYLIRKPKKQSKRKPKK